MSTNRARHLRRRLGLWTTMLTIPLGAALLAGELAIRLYAETDEIGNFVVAGREVRPYVLPIDDLAIKERQYLASDGSKYRYDPTLGWAPSPNGQFVEGGIHYAYNSAGLRSAPTEYTKTPESGTYRIAIFGDSFTEGADAHFHQTWGAVLGDLLADTGMEVEVLNFGVSAYGIDQAFLRWRTLGADFEPDLVILGLQPENVKRNVNLHRKLYYASSGVFLFKPRFVLSSDQALQLINVPTPPPDQVVDIVRSIDDWPLIDQDFHYDPQDYEPTWWRTSRLVATSLEVVHRLGLRDKFYSPQSEPVQVSMAIIREFEREVRSADGEFLVVYLPTLGDSLVPRSKGQRPMYQDFLDMVQSEFELISPVPALMEGETPETFARLYFEGHFSAEGNARVARVLADRLRADLPQQSAEPVS